MTGTLDNNSLEGSHPVIENTCKSGAKKKKVLS